MKKILFLMAIAITLQFAAKAQVPSPSCSNYTFPSDLRVINWSKCAINVDFFLVARNSCIGAPPAPVSMPVAAMTGNSIPLPSSFASYSPVNYVIMAQITWYSASGCDQTPTIVQVDGLKGVGNNCWSCGPYVAPGSGSTALMPSCPACNSTGTAYVDWTPGTGYVTVNP